MKGVSALCIKYFSYMALVNTPHAKNIFYDNHIQTPFKQKTQFSFLVWRVITINCMHYTQIFHLKSKPFLVWSEPLYCVYSRCTKVTTNKHKIEMWLGIFWKRKQWNWKALKFDLYFQLVEVIKKMYTSFFFVWKAFAIESKRKSFRRIYDIYISIIQCTMIYYLFLSL